MLPLAIALYPSSFFPPQVLKARSYECPALQHLQQEQGRLGLLRLQDWGEVMCQQAQQHNAGASPWAALDVTCPLFIRKVSEQASGAVLSMFGHTFQQATSRHTSSLH